MNKLYVFILTLMSYVSFAQTGLIVNEVSQGSSGVKEYVELVVIAPAGTCTVDIRGWIVDDNNGDFSGGPVAGSGMAAGHIRFTTAAQWQNVPTGAIILIYNSADKNTSILLADDINDSNNDKVYVIPVNTASLIEGNNTLPVVGNAAYSPVVYGAATWGCIGLSNDGDVMQVRTPAGAFFHGLAFGDGTCNCINAGPGILVDPCTASSCTGSKVYSFTNSVDNNPFNATNFSIGAVPANETPGAANGVANATWINSIICPLPIQEIALKSSVQENTINLSWNIQLANATKNVTLLHSTPSTPWEILTVSEHASYTHQEVEEGTHFYRLVVYTQDGKALLSNIESISLSKEYVFTWYPNPMQTQLNLSCHKVTANQTVAIYNAVGQLVHRQEITQSTSTIDVSSWQSGAYFYQIVGLKERYSGTLIKE